MRNTKAERIHTSSTLSYYAPEVKCIELTTIRSTNTKNQSQPAALWVDEKSFRTDERKHKAQPSCRVHTRPFPGDLAKLLAEMISRSAALADPACLHLWVVKVLQTRGPIDRAASFPARHPVSGAFRSVALPRRQDEVAFYCRLIALLLRAKHRRVAGGAALVSFVVPLFDLGMIPGSCQCDVKVSYWSDTELCPCPFASAETGGRSKQERARRRLLS